MFLTWVFFFKGVAFLERLLCKSPTIIADITGGP